jgi:hypothetical protein
VDPSIEALVERVQAARAARTPLCIRTVTTSSLGS